MKVLVLFAVLALAASDVSWGQWNGQYCPNGKCMMPGCASGTCYGGVCVTPPVALAAQSGFNFPTQGWPTAEAVRPSRTNSVTVWKTPKVKLPADTSAIEAIAARKKSREENKAKSATLEERVANLEKDMDLVLDGILVSNQKLDYLMSHGSEEETTATPQTKTSQPSVWLETWYGRRAAFVRDNVIFFRCSDGIERKAYERNGMLHVEINGMYYPMVEAKETRQALASLQ